MQTTQRQIAAKWAESIIAERNYRKMGENGELGDRKRAEEIRCDKLRHEAMTMLSQYAKYHGVKEWELRRKLHQKAELIVEKMA